MRIVGIAADRDVRRPDVSLLKFEQRERDQGALAESAWRQQEHLLTVCKITDEVLQFFLTVHEMTLLYDLAEDEWILHKSRFRTRLSLYAKRGYAKRRYAK